MARSTDKRWINARRAAAARMIDAADLLRRRPEAMNHDARERVAQLLDLLADQGLESTHTKTWDIASGLARALLEIERPELPPGRPLPSGYARPQRS